MKFKVTATIPIELEIDCQSKKEALDTATTILQEQRYDDDYASIVADCIESALVSGSITMTAVDDHEALVNELRTKRKISIQDMDAFLGYEIDKNDDMMFDDDYINANLWMMDVDKALGLDVCTSDNDEYVTISVNWYKATEQTTDSLEEFRQRQPNDVCNLKVKEHHPTYRNMSRNYPGSIFLVEKQVHIMQGIAGSKDGKATTYKDTNANSIAAGKCKFVAKNSGILFV